MELETYWTHPGWPHIRPEWHNDLYSHLYVYITEDECYCLVVTGGPDFLSLSFEMVLDSNILKPSPGVQLMTSIVICIYTHECGIDSIWDWLEGRGFKSSSM